MNEQVASTWRSDMLFMHRVLAVALVLFALAVASIAHASEPGTAPTPLMERFLFLSKNGNSTCAASFKASISAMPAGARLQGSCCSPMTFHRYSEQVQALKKYRDIALIPPDPYDVDAALAARLMRYFGEIALTPKEQAAYDLAMKTSHEKGPCCCRCWRWDTYGGLAKNLIRFHGFSGEQIAKVWDLSDGCGGDEEHQHE